jgi:hypothetical protein
MLGMPYISSPPGRSARSYTVTQWPAELSWAAAESPAGTGSDHGNFLASALAGRGGADPSRFPALLGDGILNVFDGHGRTGDTQHAGSLTGGRANPTGEFREVVGLMESIQGFLPAAPDTPGRSTRGSGC